MNAPVAPDDAILQILAVLALFFLVWVQWGFVVALIVFTAVTVVAP